MNHYRHQVGLSCLWLGKTALRKSSGSQQLYPYHFSFTRMCMAGFTWQFTWHIINVFSQMLLSFHQSEGLCSKSSFSAAHIWHEFIVSTKSKMDLEGDTRVNVKDLWIHATLGCPPWPLKIEISLNSKGKFFFTRLSFSTWLTLRRGLLLPWRQKLASCQHWFFTTPE